MKSNKDHRVMALKVFQYKDFEDVLKRPLYCLKPRHEKEELKYFCNKCESPVCQTCATMSHSGHTLEHIEEKAERQKIETKSFLDVQRRNLQKKMNSLGQLDEYYAQLVRQRDDMKESVQGLVNKLIATIEAKKQKIFAALENETKNVLENLTMQKTEVERQIKTLESSLEKADKLLIRSSNAEIVQLKKPIETIFQAVIQNQPVDLDPEKVPAIVFAENPKFLSTINTEEIGTLLMKLQTKAFHSVAEGKGLGEAIVNREAHFTLTTRNVEGGQCYNENDHVTVEILDEQERQCATEVRMNDNKNGLYQIGYSSNFQGICKAIVKVNGEHVCGSPFAVQVKPFQLKAVLSFGNKGSSKGTFKFPWGVAVNARNEMAVTDCENNRVQLYNSDGYHLRSFGKKGNKAGEFYSPMGIAFDNNGNLLVSDNNNYRVQIFNREGEFMASIPGKGSSVDRQFLIPWGLSVDGEGNILVADAGNKLIIIFSPAGKFLMKIGGQGSLSHPVHCVQSGRFLFVSDSGEHCIKVFDRNGNFQYKFGKKGTGDGEFNGPGCMTVNRSGHIIVCDTNNNRIQLFEFDGTFVGKFGTKGNGLGEIRSPNAIAILSTGRIVVVDQSNHRLQMFE